MSAIDLEPYLPLVPSVVFNGHRIRFLFDTIHPRPLNETFHEFLIGVLQWTLGENWWKHQLRLPAVQQHSVVSWHNQYCKLTLERTNDDHRRSDGVTYSSKAAGPIWSLLTLGYDLFCIQVNRTLPAFMASRLRDHATFQSVRYEIAVAAILQRSGFDLDYFDEKTAEGSIASSSPDIAYFKNRSRSRRRVGNAPEC